jgi:hypothetical protein
VGEMSFLLSIFAVIEHLNKSDLTNTSKKLIINYVNEASGEGMAQKARTAIWEIHPDGSAVTRQHSTEIDLAEARQARSPRAENGIRGFARELTGISRSEAQRDPEARVERERARRQGSRPGGAAQRAVDALPGPSPAHAEEAALRSAGV